MFINKLARRASIETGIHIMVLQIDNPVIPAYSPPPLTQAEPARNHPKRNSCQVQTPIHFQNTLSFTNTYTHFRMHNMTQKTRHFIVHINIHKLEILPISNKSLAARRKQPHSDAEYTHTQQPNTKKTQQDLIFVGHTMSASDCHTPSKGQYESTTRKLKSEKMSHGYARQM